MDTTFVQKVFNISQEKRKPDVHRHGKADDFRAGSKVLEWVAIYHLGTLQTRPARLKQIPSDSAVTGPSYRFDRAVIEITGRHLVAETLSLAEKLGRRSQG
jgi:hypothetical protein